MRTLIISNAYVCGFIKNNDVLTGTYLPFIFMFAENGLQIITKR